MSKINADDYPLKLDQTVLKGRGAVSNPQSRFDTYLQEPIVDGWWQPEASAAAQRLETVIIEEKSRTIITTNSSPDIPFSQSINPYRGCEHGCIYCYARPSHAYWGLSPGLDFETKIIVKPDSASLLKKALAKPKYVCSAIAIGANTDPYQPLEAKLKITRSILEVLQSYRHPFSLITKSSLILRDLDLLSDMASRNLCSVAVSVTTLDNDLKRILEPRTASGRARLQTIKALTDAGVPVTMMVAPVIPMINDKEIEQILESGKQAGISSAHMILVRLPREVAPMFRQWLSVHFPDRMEHVMSLIQHSQIRKGRDGKDYQLGFHERMVGQGVLADMIRQRFKIAANRLGLNTGNRAELDTEQFYLALKQKTNHQMSLF